LFGAKPANCRIKTPPAAEPGGKLEVSRRRAAFPIVGKHVRTDACTPQRSGE
jgi:hypothetical protein